MALSLPQNPAGGPNNLSQLQQQQQQQLQQLMLQPGAQLMLQAATAGLTPAQQQQLQQQLQLQLQQQQQQQQQQAGLAAGCPPTLNLATEVGSGAAFAAVARGTRVNCQCQQLTPPSSSSVQSIL